MAGVEFEEFGGEPELFAGRELTGFPWNTNDHSKRFGFWSEFLTGAGGAHRAVPDRRRRADGADAKHRTGRRPGRTAVAGVAAHAFRGAKRIAGWFRRLRCARQE